MSDLAAKLKAFLKEKKIAADIIDGLANAAKRKAEAVGLGKKRRGKKPGPKKGSGRKRRTRKPRARRGRGIFDSIRGIASGITGSIGGAINSGLSGLLGHGRHRRVGRHRRGRGPLYTTLPYSYGNKVVV